jgi:hypothetical protein
VKYPCSVRWPHALCRFDAFGNVIRSAFGQPEVILSVEGPEGVVASLADLPDGAADIYAVATVAGAYHLHVSFGGPQGGKLADTPVNFQVLVITFHYLVRVVF